ncbi:ubiquitin-conjugating enzyme E2 U isoform X2 [Talpa occidentalis]|uniref:ubiquitin-conjugating enzyme E2 U isoform X2 n=1 Tax=Talpa occidentalis TaxID=50954 RepID=UPI00188FDB7B|nr:ubiquitin-conjugating enzyme E2 U isoform X2 [Talpa occidentalis]
MSSRAYLLLERENRKLKKNNYKGISAFPVSEDLLEWEAVIEGLQDTIWQVDQHTGQPCIDFLDNPNKWNTSYTLSSILLTLQVMLSNPVLENPVNLEAAKILTKDESKYRLIVLKLFQQPLQLKDESPKTPKKPDKIIKSTKTISFYDYYKSWCEIATSKATGYHRTALLKDPSFIEEYFKLKKHEKTCAKEWNFKYAVVMARLTREKNRYHKNNDPTEGKHHFPTPIHFSPNSQSETEIVTKIYESDADWKNDQLTDFEESWEEEVADLVAWSKTLNTDGLQD